MAIKKVRLPDNSVLDIQDSRLRFTLVDGYYLLNIDGFYDVANAEPWLIPGTDAAQEIQTTNILENENNKVTSLSSTSTHEQYPSAKCVYDIIGDVETVLTTLLEGTN